MKISELAKATGLSAKTIRFYEAEGLIPDPPRTAARTTHRSCLMAIWTAGCCPKSAW